MKVQWQVTVAPALSTSVVAARLSSVDEELIALGQQLDSIKAALDRAGSHDEAMAILDRIDTTTAAIVAEGSCRFDLGQ